MVQYSVSSVVHLERRSFLLEGIPQQGKYLEPIWEPIACLMSSCR